MSKDNKRHSVFNMLFLAIESIKFSIWFSVVIYLETYGDRGQLSFRSATVRHRGATPVSHPIKRLLFAFGPECRSRSLRNQCSPSPESSP
jgi:hypothetical protein